MVSQEYPPDTNWGGIATYTHILAKRLSELGHRVHVISLAFDEETDVEEKSLVVHRVKIKRRPFLVYFLKNRIHHVQAILDFAFRVAEKIKEIHCDEPIDIIESPETCAQAIVASIKCRSIPLVTRLHMPHFWVRKLNNIDNTLNYYGRDFLEKMQVKFSRGVSSPTKVMASIVRDKWKIDSTEVIPNFFDLENYKPDFSIYGEYLEGKKFILFFGRLETRKGPQVLSEAVPRILREDPNLKIVFIGRNLTFKTGTMKEYIQSNNKQYLRNLLFLENIPHNQLYPIIERSELVVLPSLWENFPYACLEAMHFGKVVVATGSSGFEEVIDDQISGILVEPGSSQRLGEAIVQALSNDKRESMGQRARLRALEFSSGKIVPQVVHFYSRILGN